MKLSSLKSKLLQLYSIFLLKHFKKLNILYTFYKLPKKKKRLTLQKSPHVHKKARQQFECQLHTILLQIDKKIIPDTMKYLFLNKPHALKLQIIKN